MGPIELELGTGPEDGLGFVPLVAEQPVPLTFGSQQGFHVWTNVRVRNACPEQLMLKRTATFAETSALILISQEQFSLIPASDPLLATDGWFQLPSSLPTFMCPHPAGLEVPGHRVQIRVDTTDRKGRLASVSKIVVPFCPQNAVKSACERQCAPGSSMDGGTDG